MDYTSALATLKKGMTELGIGFDESAVTLFEKYISLIESCPHNLTSITGPEEIVRGHFLDSLSVLRYFKPESGPGRLYGDIGSGAGFPLMPLKIIHQEMTAVFIDSKRKSTDFIMILREEFGFSESGCQIINLHTTEMLRQGMMKGSFDALFVRALGPALKAFDYCSPFLKKSGVLWLYKGPNYKDEVSELEKTAKKWIRELEILETKVPFLEKGRFIIKIVKA